MKTEEICDRIVRTLAACPFIKGIVLGGSRATNTDEADSDIDIGIYYEKEKLDYGMLNRLAKELDDGHRENLVCQEGGWGPWVNCGGWLKIGGCSVDLILRDWDRVMEAVRETDRGEFSAIIRRDILTPFSMWLTGESWLPAGCCIPGIQSLRNKNSTHSNIRGLIRNG